ncbi:hypothetical protein AAHC03_016426 [Spirometra sp. Aus1]
MWEWFFGNKPQLVREIEIATDSPFSQPDQAAFLEICDHINQDRNGPGIALSALFKQLERSAPGSPKTAVFTLTLLDFCVRNCGYRFLAELCGGNYLSKLKKLVEKGQLTPAARNKLLTLIKVWALAFADYVDFQPINALYSGLLRNAVHFPTVEENDVDLVKRALSPPRSCGDHRPDAPNAKTAQRIQAIRQDLHCVSLDLPAFEALLQGLACSPPDPVTLNQLRATADRLEGLQRRLRAYIGQLSESTDPKSGPVQEEEAILGELIRVDEKIRDAIQQFRSFEMMRRREEETQRTAGRILGTKESSIAAAGASVETISATNAAGTYLAETKDVAGKMLGAKEAHQPFGAFQQDERRSSAGATQMGELWTQNAPGLTLGAATSTAAAAVAETTPTTSASGTRIEETKDVARTLSEAREALQLFETLQLGQRTSSAQADGAAQMRELRVAAEQVQDLQKQVLALINECLGGNPSGSTEEDETKVAALADMNDDLLRCLEYYQRAVRRDETQKAPGWTSEAATSTAAAAAAETTPTTSASGTRMEETKDVARTLSEAREALQLFETLQLGQRTSSAQADGAAQMGELRVAAERVQDLQKQVLALINECLGGNPSGSTVEDETKVAALTDINDELLRCIEYYKRTFQRDETPKTPPRTLGATTPTAAVPAETTLATSASRTHLKETKDVARTLSEAREALQLFETLQRDQRTSSAQADGAAQMGELRVAAERVQGMQRQVLELINECLGGNPSGSTEEDETKVAALADMNDDLLRCLEYYQRAVRRDETEKARGWTFATTTPTTAEEALPVTSTSRTYVPDAMKNVAQTLSEAREALQAFETLHQDKRGSSAQVGEFRVAAERVQDMQKQVHALIDEILNGNSFGITIKGETVVAALTDMNDKLLHCLECYQRAARRDESEEKIQPEGTPKEDPARDPGTVVSEGFVASNAPESTVEAPQNSIYHNSLHQLTPPADVPLIDLSEEEIHPKGTPTEDPARDTGTVASKSFVAFNAPESTMEAPQNSVYNNSPQRLPPSADVQLIDLPGTVAGGQGWTTANDPASGTGSVTGSGHSAFEAVAEAAQSVISGQSTFPDAHMTDQPGAAAGGQQSATARDSASGTGAAPISSHAAFEGVAEAAQTANVGQSASVDTDLADQPGAMAGGQEWTTANGPASGTATVPGRGHSAFEAVAEPSQSVISRQSTSPDAQMADQFATLTTQDSPANEVSALSKAVAPIPADLQNANTEFVTLPDESRLLRSQMQDADALQQHAAQRTPSGPSVDQLRATILQLLTTVQTNVKSARDLLGKVTMPGNPVEGRDVLQIKNLCTAIQDDLQKLSDLRMDYEWMTTQSAPRPNADGTTDVDPLLMDLYIVPAEANGVLDDSKLFLESNMAVLEHQGTVQHAGKGTPTEPSVNELKVAISVILARVKTNATSLNDFLRSVNTLGAPVTSSAIMSIKNLSTAIQDDLQHLSRMRVDYELMTTQCPPRSKVDGAADVDPLLMELYIVPEEAGRALEASKLLLDTTGAYFQEDVSSSATDGQEFRHDGSGDLRHGDNASFSAENKISKV